MLVLFVVLPLIIIDQLTKFIILKNFQPGDSFPVIKNIFHITFVSNKGMAFGIFSETGSIFIWISFVAAISIVLILTLSEKIFHGIGKYKYDTTSKIALGHCRRQFSRKVEYTRIFLSLILAGALGNLIDRIRFGYVVDFLDFRIWPVFNIADACISIGTVLLVLQIFRHKPENI